MAGKFSFSPEDFQHAAVKYRSELLMLPIIGCQDTLQFMTSRPGIRYKERVGTMTGDAQFAPYNPARSTDYNLNLSYREIETFFGSVVAKFEPNSAISTLLGTGATKGDGQMTTPTAKHVLSLIAKNLSSISTMPFGMVCAMPTALPPKTFLTALTQSRKAKSPQARFLPTGATI